MVVDGLLQFQYAKNLIRMKEIWMTIPITLLTNYHYYGKKCLSFIVYWKYVDIALHLK